MSYRWWHLPGRAVLAARALGKSLWQDWFPPHTCRNCEWSRDKGFTTLHCTFGLGEGYGRAVWKDGWCKHWKKRT
jgi:hypothetical protein